MKKLTLVFLSIIFVLPLCAAKTPMNKKDITIKAAKIAGYTIGFMLPTYWLLHEYYEGKTYNDPFITKLFKKPMQKFYSDTNNRRHYLSTVSAHGAILGCLGYSTYGLYTELEPSMKKILSLLKNKVSPKK